METDTYFGDVKNTWSRIGFYRKIKIMQYSFWLFLLLFTFFIILFTQTFIKEVDIAMGLTEKAQISAVHANNLLEIKHSK